MNFDIQKFKKIQLFFFFYTTKTTLILTGETCWLIRHGLIKPVREHEELGLLFSSLTQNVLSQMSRLNLDK